MLHFLLVAGLFFAPDSASTNNNCKTSFMVKLLIFSIFGCFTLSGSPSIYGLRQNLYSPEGSRCALPTPKNIHIEIIGTSYFQIAWDPVPEAAFFRVNLTKTSSGLIASTKLVPALSDRNFALMAGLEPGIEYSYTVFSVCANGMESPKPF